MCINLKPLYFVSKEAFAVFIFQSGDILDVYVGLHFSHYLKKRFAVLSW